MIRSLLAALLLLLGFASAATAQQSQPFHLLSVVSPNNVNIKPAPGQVVTFACANTGTVSIAFLKFYDTAAAPTCNSNTVVLTFPCMTSSSIVVPLSAPVQFLNGIAMCLTGAISDTDNSNAATGVAVDVFFK